MTDITKRIIPIIIILAFLAAPMSAAALTVKEVEPDLMCNCGCGDNLADCGCEVSAQYRDIIKNLIAQGKSKDDILDYFVDKYGEEILAILPDTGFNKVAYLVPGLAFLGGGILAVVIVRVWTSPRRKEGEEEDGDSPDSPDDISDDMKDRIDEELKQFEEE
jgi:cytochrome c-type biogenesis protein CcmH